MIAEVPPIGIFKEVNYFGGYEIAIPSGQILKRFSPQELADRWGETLGERVKADFRSLSPPSKAVAP
jgi:hypothetical protein